MGFVDHLTNGIDVPTPEVIVAPGYASKLSRLTL
jgi:hypothetical protein